MLLLAAVLLAAVPALPAAAAGAADDGAQGGGAAPGTTPPAAGATSFVFAPCNRTYQRNGTELEPVHQGAVTLLLASPHNQLTLEQHRLDLTPLPDGTHRAHFEVTFAGEGELVMDVEMGGSVSRLEDRVRIPRQKEVVDARVKLARSEAGYELTPVELPKEVKIRIESDLAARFATICDSFTFLLGLDCDPLRAGLSRAAFAMPEPGETYLLPAECVSDDVARRLDAYLGLAPRDGG
jgi:hypothetical protein